MDFTWTVPVAIIVAGATYAIFARYLAHKERLATSRNTTTDQSASQK